MLVVKHDEKLLEIHGSRLACVGYFSAGKAHQT
jgi:hypothetical protein